MKYRRYAEYKVSGVEWLGEVPAHWETTELSRCLERIDTGWTPDSMQRHADESEWAVLKVGCVRDGKFYEDEHKALSSELDVPIALEVQAGDLLMSRANTLELVGSVGLIRETRPRLTLSDKTFRLVFTKQLLPDYANYLLQGSIARTQIELGAKGASQSMKNIGQEVVRRLAVPVPPLTEQVGLIEFLDRETSHIDALVAKQERLIAVLQEKRQALISHAVTKGLNPDAPMKDSGVEWLGEVPAHWTVGKLKHFVDFFDWKRIPLSADERGQRQGEYPYYGASGIIDYIDAYIFEEELILVGEDGANLVNRATPLAFIARGKYWVNNHAHILRPTDGCSGYWAERIEAIDIVPFVTGSAQPKLTAEALGDLLVAVPPTSCERQEIYSYLEKERQRFDILESKALMIVVLLQERRAALISAAVTGKIDVRDWAVVPVSS